MDGAGCDRRDHRPLAARPPPRLRRPALSRGRPTPLADPLLTVVMPIFNERGTVEEIIERVLAVPLRIELIAVDDASPDGSPGVVVGLAESGGLEDFGMAKNPG